jgi:2-dehydropantoate 2-reductase
MNVLVFGAGAVGSTIGGMLAKAGHSVTLVGRDPHMRRIAASGLKIAGLWGDHAISPLKAVTEIPADAAPDWILLTTKSYDTESAAGVLAKRFLKDVPVLHLQNGVGNADLLAEALGWPRVISGMIIIGFQIVMAGRTAVTVSADKIRIGRHEGRIDTVVTQMVEAFNQAGMPAEAVSDIDERLWGKLLYNAALNPLGGILGVKYGELLNPRPWSIIERVVAEAFAVLQAAGQEVSWPDAAAYLAHLKAHQIPSTFEHQPSMLTDLRHARRTEIDFINGALVRLGEQQQIPTPVNQTLVTMIHALEENAQKGILHPTMQAKPEI